MDGDKKPRKRTKSNGEGSVYKTTRKKTRVDGTVYEVVTWRGYITLDVVGGKQQKKYAPSAPTKAEASKNVRDLINQRDAGTLTTTRALTVEEWVTHYHDELAPRKPSRGRVGMARSSISSGKSYARNHVFPRIGTIKLDRLRAEDLEEVYQSMVDAGLSVSTIKSCHTMMRSALDVAWKRGRVARNVAALVMLPIGAPPADVREVTVDEMRAILGAANRRRMAVRWVVRLAYGIRQGECLGLSWDDVEFDNKQVWIRQQLQRDRAEHGCGQQIGMKKAAIRSRHGCGKPVGTTTVGAHGEKIPPRSVYSCGKRRAGLCPQAVTTGGKKDIGVYPCGKDQPAQCPQHKGGGLMLVPVKTKTSKAPLPLPDPIAELLRARRQEQRVERIQEGPRWKGWQVDGKKVDLVFTQPTGKPLMVQDDWQEWADLLVEAGVDPVKPHAARHAMATLLVSLKVEPRVVMAMLRHADVAMSMNLYAKAPTADMVKAAEAIATALLGKTGSE